MTKNTGAPSTPTPAQAPPPDGLPADDSPGWLIGPAPGGWTGPTTVPRAKATTAPTKIKETP